MLENFKANKWAGSRISCAGMLFLQEWKDKRDVLTSEWLQKSISYEKYPWSWPDLCPPRLRWLNTCTQYRETKTFFTKPQLDICQNLHKSFHCHMTTTARYIYTDKSPGDLAIGPITSKKNSYQQSKWNLKYAVVYSDQGKNTFKVARHYSSISHPSNYYFDESKVEWLKYSHLDLMGIASSEILFLLLN